MAQILFEFESTGGDAVAESLEDIQVKERLASEETKRLSAELRKIRESGQVSAQGIELLTRELIRAEHAQRDLSQKARGFETAQASIGRASRQSARGMAENINMLTEMSLGLGGLSPKMREFSIALAMGGNNAVTMAASMGPLGIAIGILTGLVPTLISSLASAEGQARETADAMRQAADEVDRMAQSIAALDTADALRAGVGQDPAEIQAEIERLENARRGFERERAEGIAQFSAFDRGRYVPEGGVTDETLQRFSDGRGVDIIGAEQARAASEHIRAIDAQLEQLRGGLERAQDESREAAAATERQARAEEEAVRRRDEAEERRRQRVREGRQGQTQAEREARAAQREVEQRMRREEQFFNELQRLREQDAEAEIRQRRETLEAIEEAELEALEKRKAHAREVFEDQQRLLEKQKGEAETAFKDTKDEAESVLGPAIQGISGAISEVIAGSRSADEAFQGLLAGFLEMLAQKAALEAASEFASAIASFASQDYSGGALHLAAGVAWTAVAVASGAASIAVAPPAAATPAEPQRDDRPQNNAGSQVVVNLNGAVVTAGTRAELGRELGQMIAVGDRRFGAAA